MALTIIAVATGVSSAAPKQQPGQKFYGALYWGDISQTESALYWGLGTSEASAKQTASNICQQKGATNCQLLVWVYNGWVALFQGTKNGAPFQYFRYDRTEREAVAGAMKNCQANATGCELIGTWKTAFDPNKQTKGGFK
jgi:hypothetical protein